MIPVYCLLYATKRGDDVPTSTSIGESDYRRGAFERLRESGILLRQELFAGSVYLAGRAVEAMLRGLILKNDADIRSGRVSLETGHDLRRLLARVASLGVLAEDEHRIELAANVQTVGRLWINNMRFFPTARLQSYWRHLGELGGKRTLKTAAHEY